MPSTTMKAIVEAIADDQLNEIAVCSWRSEVYTCVLFTTDEGQLYLVHPEENSMFTTPTGQTGKDALVFEATQIHNLQRELDTRMRKLCEVLHEESPELLRNSTDFHPNLGVKAKSAEHLAAYLHFDQEGYIEWLRENR